MSQNGHKKIALAGNLEMVGANWAGVNDLQTGCSDKNINLHLMIK